MRAATVAAIQHGPGGVDLAWLRSALLAERADLVVLPELADGSYFPLKQRTGDPPPAQRLDGNFVSELCQIARDVGCYLAAGLYLDDNGKPVNAAVVITPDGAVVPGRSASGERRVAYHKVHLCNIPTPTGRFYEDDYFIPGAGHVLWDTELGRLGILICYDRHFPEAWRLMRSAGADIVAVPVASPTSSRPWFVAEMQAMCLQQGVYGVIANRAGVEALGADPPVVTTYGGLSAVIAPDGTPLAVADTQPNSVVRARTDPALLNRIRAQHHFTRDLRQELYERERDQWERRQSSLDAG